MNSENNSQTTSQVVSAPSSIVTMQATRINGIATPNASQRKHICTCTPEQLRQQKRARKESFRKVNLWD